MFLARRAAPFSLGKRDWIGTPSRPAETNLKCEPFSYPKAAAADVPRHPAPDQLSTLLSIGLGHDGQVPPFDSGGLASRIEDNGSIANSGPRPSSLPLNSTHLATLSRTVTRITPNASLRWRPCPPQNRLVFSRACFVSIARSSAIVTFRVQTVSRQVSTNHFLYSPLRACHPPPAPAATG